MEVKHGYDVTFVEEISAHLTCVICQLALRNPICLVDCGHRLCKTCFTEMKDNAILNDDEVLCPYDRTEVDETKVFEDQGLARMILELKVKCNHWSKGCTWQGELSNLEHHLQHNCGMKDREDTTLELQEIRKEMRSLSQRVLTNEVDIIRFKYEGIRKDEEVAQLKEKIASLEEDVKELNEKVEELTSIAVNNNNNDYDSNDNNNDFDGDETIEISDFEWEDIEEQTVPQKETTATTPTGSITTKRFKKLDLCEAVTSAVVDGIAPLIEAHCKISTNECVRQLEAVRKQTTILTQLTANRTVVYKWKIDQYFACKDIGYMESPRFYTSLNGHCCCISVKWSGFRKRTLGLFFHICRDEEGNAVQKSFRFEIKFEINGRGNDKECPCVPFETVLRNQEDFRIGEGEGKTMGVGCYNVLSMPRLKDFVFRDCMYITCILVPR